MGKLPANAGSERTAVSHVSNANAQQPADHITQHEFIRTCDPAKMSRKQRRLCEKKIDRPKQRRKKPW